MLKESATFGVLVFVWIVAGLAGLAFLSAAFQEKTRRSRSRLTSAFYEVRFRLRVAFGLFLILFVAGSIAWMYLK